MKVPQRLATRLLAGCILVVCAGVVVRYLMVQPELELPAVSLPAPAASASTTQLEHPAATIEKEALNQSPRSTPKLEAAVSKEIESLIRRDLMVLTEALRDTERSNASIVYDRHLSQSHVVTLRVKAPTREQLDPVYSSISRTLSALTGHPKAEREYRSQAEKLLGSYNQFPKPFVVLRMSVAYDGSRSLFSKQFTANETEGIPNESGIVRIDGMNPPELDGQWGAKDSWASKRYGYLFEIEDEKDSINP